MLPTKVPYYVTLVGGPDAIPFDFQYLLDVEYAVGRLAFDTPDLYRVYAEGVAAYETAAAGPRNTKEVVYWGTRHPGDRSTQMSADSLIRPLAEGAFMITSHADFGASLILVDSIWSGDQIKVNGDMVVAVVGACVTCARSDGDVRKSANASATRRHATGRGLMNDPELS